MNFTIMGRIPNDKINIKSVNSKKSLTTNSDEILHQLAFNNSLQANLISAVRTGNIIIANNAACKLLGYSKTELLNKSRSTIFEINEDSFRRMLYERSTEGQTTGFITAITKTGKTIPCEVTSAVFLDPSGTEMAISTIVDLSQSILKQQNIDRKKEKLVAENIDIANSRQKEIDIRKDKMVADNIVLAKSRQIEIDTEKEKIAADNISIAKRNQQSIDDLRDKIVAENIVLAKSRQRGIDAEKEKLVIDNIELALAKSDARLAENNEWIKYIAETSYDVIWDWNIITGDIYVGDSVEEVFGYKVRDNMVRFSDFSRCIMPEQKDMVVKKLLRALDSTDKNWNDSYLFKRQNGSIASTTCRANIVRDEEGRAIRLVGAIQDVSRLEELEKKLKEQIIIQKELSGIFLVAAKLSFDGIWDWNLLINDFYLGKGFEELFGYPIKNNTGNIGADWEKYIYPDDRESVEKSLRDAIDSSASQWEQAFRFVRYDGSIAKVLNRASIIRYPDGKAYRIIGAMQDISKLKVLEDRLEQEINLKGKQIAAAMEDAKDAERSDIGKELHDNVNQLLGASRLYLDMAKRGGDNRELFLSRSSEYTLTAIEAIRKLTKGLTTDIIKNLGLCESIEKLTGDMMDVNPVKISFNLGNFKEEGVHDKFKLNVFRIVQEHLNNILKHAKAKEVSINLSQDDNSIILSIFDNGIGFDTGKKQTGIGVDNIKSRAATYSGTTNFISRPGEGCVLTVLFPLVAVQLNDS